ncbi:MAG: acyl-CoA dehydrogenase [Robiginitomaculum sp.]|nr:MAG: acyl-CoA dehydrogenase [Robiginitomaculum sp.]
MPYSQNNSSDSKALNERHLSVTKTVLHLRQLFQNVAKGLAKSCSENGRLGDSLLDAQQLNCYELAFAASELRAAEQSLLITGKDGSDVNKELALVFAADVLPVTVGRLEKISASLKITDDLANLRQTFEYKEMVSASLPIRLASVGAEVFTLGNSFHQIETNEDVDIAREVFKRFAEDVVSPFAEDIHRYDMDIPEDLLSHMKEMGVFGLSIPEKFGGSAPNDGEDNLTMIAITEALSEVSLGAAGSLITRPEILTRAILAGGTEAQKSKWLPKIAVGDPLCAIAITEPDYGSDAANLKLKAVKVDGGWTLNGAKTWCTFAGRAGVLMVVARTGPEKGFKGLSVFLVDKPKYDGHSFEYSQEGGGRLSGKAISTIGYRGMHSYDLSFDEVFVPDENVLGEEAGLGRGFYYTMSGMTGGRIQTSARACGVMIAALKSSIQYAVDRKIFGIPLAEHQLTQTKIATMTARFMAARHLTYKVGELLNTGTGQMEASLAKLFACRSAELITRDALQIHGGMGYAEECPVSRYFVDARVLSIFEGAEEVLALRVIARGILRNELKAIE